ncbi:MAG: hypothetical protein IJC17_04080 [Clostridia bacterium]|nr:hypothetical protein [Clostridia bacterium]
MSSSSDFSDRIAASRAEMLAAYRRQQPAVPPETPTSVSSLQTPVDVEPRVSPTEEPLFGNPPADTNEASIIPPMLPPFDSIGYLQIHASAGNDAIPIPRAMIVVTRNVNGGEELVALGETDQSGNTLTWSLPAPDPQMFESSTTAATPAYYTVRTFADGYVTVRNLLVPLYGGVTAIQDVNLIPLPEAVTESEVTFTAGAPANL